MTALDIFTFESFPVHAVLTDDEPWFVANDVAVALGIANSRNMVARLDDDERGVRLMDTLGGQQNVTVINESGLYSAVLRSDSPKAGPFKRWVTRVVLPSIRKRGSYSIEKIREPEESPEQFLARALTLASGIIEKKDAKIAELEPKAIAYERFMDSTSLIKIEVAARQAGIGRTTAYRLLREGHVLQKWNRSPMQDYAHRFHEVATPRETPAGEVVTDYTTKIKPEHFDWLVSTLERLAGKESRATA